MRSAERWESVEGYLCAVLLGYSFYTEEKVKELYRVAGIGHLLAISGLHISFFGNGLYRGLGKPDFLFYRPV